MSANASKEAPSARAVIDNYLAYNHLTDEDRHLFTAAHLDMYLGDAYKRLFGKRPRSGVYKTPLYSEEELHHINARVKYALELIGEHSNARFGKSAVEQHKFFQRRGDQETFFTHLFQAIQVHKRNIISSYNSDAWYIPAFNDGHLKLEVLRNKKIIFFEIEGKAIKEGELYAACVFYAINFAFDAIKMKDAIHLSRLLASMFHFGSGTSYQTAYGQKGGEENAKDWKADKEEAYALFENNNIYNTHGSKHEAMLEKLLPLLPRAGIMISRETVKTRWLPDFIDRAKISR